MMAASIGTVPQSDESRFGHDPLKLLIIEDEALVAMLVEDALTLHGHQVTAIADTLAAALEAVDAERPDLVLCDVKLAEGDCGITAARLIADRGIPCVFLSGNCPDQGGHPLIIGCISKPFRPGSLGSAVHAAYAIAKGGRPSEPPATLRLY
ncbi:response regulator [Sphingomonas sp.]|uniref:response regulator n=1 Tax=Sphingomonas sp. TaxID=28214 RepID=UPI00289F8A2D|nr:response regulator [Sphingomonas sp.]